MSVFRDMAIDHGYDPDEGASYFEAMYREMERQAEYEVAYREYLWWHEMLYRSGIYAYPLIQAVLNEPVLMEK